MFSENDRTSFFAAGHTYMFKLIIFLNSIFIPNCVAIYLKTYDNIIDTEIYGYWRILGWLSIIFGTSRNNLNLLGRLETQNLLIWIK